MLQTTQQIIHFIFGLWVTYSACQLIVSTCVAVDSESPMCDQSPTFNATRYRLFLCGIASTIAISAIWILVHGDLAGGTVLLIAAGLVIGFNKRITCSAMRQSIHSQSWLTNKPMASYSLAVVLFVLGALLIISGLGVV
jgi:hypothetical protein